MKSLLLALALIPTAVLPAQPASERFAHLNRQADQFVAAFDLDSARTALEQAIGAAADLDPVTRSGAHARLFDVYRQLQRRDGRSWINIGLPHLMTAMDLVKSSPDARASRLSIQFAAAVLQLSGGRLGAKLASFFNENVAQLEAKLGPVPKESAIIYEALAIYPDGSPEQTQALNACDLLILSSQTLAPDYATLLCDCAAARLRGKAYADAIRFARMARGAVGDGGHPYPSDEAFSYWIEAQAEAEGGDVAKGLVTLNSAAEVSRRALGPNHELRERILNTRIAMLEATGQRAAAAETRRELKAWVAQRDKRMQASSPIRIPKLLSGTLAGDAVAFVVVLILPDGKATLLYTFGEATRGSAAFAAKAVAGWKFQPYQLDGKPVPGVTIYPVYMP